MAKKNQTVKAVVSVKIEEPKPEKAEKAKASKPVFAPVEVPEFTDLLEMKRWLRLNHKHPMDAERIKQERDRLKGK